MCVRERQKENIRVCPCVRERKRVNSMSKIVWMWRINECVRERELRQRGDNYRKRGIAI